MFSLNQRNIRVAISPSCNLNCIYCDGQQKKRKRGRPGAMEDFRRKPLSQGVIDTETCIKIIEALHLAGFEGMAITGGEPLLNPKWDLIVNRAKEIGMVRIKVTTNGTLLNAYLKKNKHLPKGLTLLTISLDTIDADRFKKITRGGNFEEVMNGLKKAKKDNPKLLIRTNKVLLRSDRKSLQDYIEFCEKAGVIDEINLLNLILKDDLDKKFFEKEFISASEIMDYFSAHTKYNFSIDRKYEFNTRLPSGLRIIIKDTNPTLRSNLCENCPIYCQEGFYTVRVATDGTITACPDFRAKLPFINGPVELENGTLFKKVNKLVQSFRKVKLENTLNEFFRRNNIKLKNKD